MADATFRFNHRTRRDVMRTGTAAFGTTILSGLFPHALAAAPATLVVAAPATPESLDPEYNASLGTIDALGNLYDCLVEYKKVPDPKDPEVMREDIDYYPDRPGGVNLVGKLAESWSVDPAGSWVAFQLRKGVKSAWGNELTADDVKWTWDRKFALNVIGGFWIRIFGMTGPDNVKVVDRYAVRIELPHPSPLLLKLQVVLYNMIFDSTKCKQMATTKDPWAKDFLANNSAGFGPYKVESLQRGQQIVFKAQEDYYRGKPAFDTVVFKEVPSSTTRLSLLQGGAVDIAEFLQPFEIEHLKTQAGVTVDSVAATPLFYIALNSKFEPLNKIPVRRAMNHAFPVDDVLKTVFRGTASAMTGCMPKIYPGFYGKGGSPYPYDLDKAKALLKEVGLEGGFKTTLAYDAGDAVQEPIAVLFQTSLRQIGVDLALRKIPAATFYTEASGHTQPMLISTLAPFGPDPGYSVELYFDSNSFLNYASYKSDDVDKLLAEAAVTADNTRRFEMAKKMQEIVIDEAPWIFIGDLNFTLARRSDLKGFTYYTSNNLRFHDLHRGS
jgi:peptide/nickel transport system substrate-binding protein